MLAVGGLLRIVDDIALDSIGVEMVSVREVKRLALDIFYVRRRHALSLRRDRWT